MFFRRDNEWEVKDESNKHVLYSTKYFAQTHKTHLYRGAAEFGDHLATIEHVSDDIWLITKSSEDRGWFFRTPCFDYEGDTFCWSGRSRLTNTAGTTLVQLETGSWSYTKVGDFERNYSSYCKDHTLKLEV